MTKKDQKTRGYKKKLKESYKTTPFLGRRPSLSLSSLPYINFSLFVL
jgi:hypothetical protein